jgi:hypothetical protein
MESGMNDDFPRHRLIMYETEGLTEGSHVAFSHALSVIVRAEIPFDFLAHLQTEHLELLPKEKGVDTELMERDAVELHPGNHIPETGHPRLDFDLRKNLGSGKPADEAGAVVRHDTPVEPQNDLRPESGQVINDETHEIDD